LGDAFSPLAEREFRLLWMGRVCSLVGDTLIPVALAFAVLSVDDRAWALGAVLATLFASRVALTLVGGVVADRLPRRAVMLACDGVRACVEIFIAAMLFTHQMTLTAFLVTGAIFGAASAFFGPASDGLVPQTVGAGRLQRANALLRISQNSLNIVGPLASGALIAAFGTGTVFALDGVTFLLSAWFLMRLRIGPHERAVPARFLVELGQGFHEVASRGWVRASLLCFAVSNFCFASFLVLGPKVFESHFASARLDWGLVMACGALGAIVGAFGSIRVRPRRPLSFVLALSFLLGTPMLALARPLPVAAIAAAWFVGFGTGALSNTTWETLLQQRIPANVYARVRSYDILVSFIFMPLGFLAFPLIANVAGFTRTLIAAGVMCGVTNLAIAFAPDVRAVTETPEPQLVDTTRPRAA
jgi:MFS family permease